MNSEGTPKTDKKYKKYSNRKLIATALTIATVFVIAVIAITYVRMSKQLYNESVSQLTEMTSQMIERLEAQIDYQWSHVKKTRALLEDEGSLTAQETGEIFVHYEKMLPLEGRTLKFLALDSDGNYYSNNGAQGKWSEVSSLADLERQSFVYTSAVDGQDYMAFAMKPTSSITIDGHDITRVILIRPMSEMERYFKSSAYDGNNLTFIVDIKGEYLYEAGQLEGVEHDGSNIFECLRSHELPHLGYEDLLKAAETGNSIASDVKINGKDYFFVYDPLPQYDWGVVLIVSDDDVAVGAHEMVSYILKLFVFLELLVVAVATLIAYFIIRIQKNNILLEESEKNEKILTDANAKLTTARDDAENALEVANKATKQAENALEVANEATKAKSQFLANMSHDIRTPMNAIIGISKLIEHDMDNPSKLEYYVRRLNTTGQYMLGLINDILDMSKIESGEIQLSYEPIKMADQVGQIESIIRPQCNDKQQEFTVNVHDVKHEYLIGDSLRLRQVFLNLLTNAVKYTPYGGKISFELREIPCDNPKLATICTSIRDNGYGMSEDFQRRMFESFTREEGSVTNRIQGTGLGLAITKSIVDMMGGTIKVESQVDKGSCFDVQLTLPIDQETPKLPKVKKVMLVSGEESLVSNVSNIMGTVYSNIELLTTSTINEAIEALKDFDADVILLSEIVGIEAQAENVRNLRSRAANAMVFFCYTPTQREYVRDALAFIDLDGLIARPFFVENLINAIEQVRKSDDPAVPSDIVSSLSGKRFLCAEDNEINAEILEALLDIQEASCTIYPNGDELVKAFADVKEGEYDAILMDVQMPIMNGLDATRAIRTGANPLGKKIPIVAMTANAFVSDIQECLDAGMDAHVSKPIDIKTLEHVVIDVTENRGGRSKIKKIIMGGR